jgi:hypothetical protein
MISTFSPHAGHAIDGSGTRAQVRSCASLSRFRQSARERRFLPPATPLVRENPGSVSYFDT